MYCGNINRPGSYVHLELPQLITDTLKEMQRQGEVGPRNEEGVPIWGGDGFLSFQRNRPQDRSQRPIESHIQYLDLHLCVVGVECIDHWPAPDRLDDDHVPYDKKQDVIFYTDKRYPEACSTEKLFPGCFVIFEPDHPHRTNVKVAGASDEVFKVIGKIPMDLRAGRR